VLLYLRASDERGRGGDPDGKERGQLRQPLSAPREQFGGEAFVGSGWCF
jgi:hypothetical protein